VTFDEFWQENRRFLGVVALGVLVFLVAQVVIGRTWGDELAAERRARGDLERALRGPLFTRADSDLVEAENDRLVAAWEELVERVAFRPRPAYTLAADAGAPTSQYHRTVARTRDELLRLAGRGNLHVEETLGLPELSPTREDEIERYLEALDVVDRAVRLALATGVGRVEDVRIELDPRLDSRGGVGAVERTRVELRLVGNGAALGRFLAETQRGERPLVVDSLELVRSRRADADVAADLALVCVRVRAPRPVGDDGDGGGQG